MTSTEIQDLCIIIVTSISAYLYLAKSKWLLKQCRHLRKIEPPGKGHFCKWPLTWGEDQWLGEITWRQSNFGATALVFYLFYFLKRK